MMETERRLLPKSGLRRTAQFLLLGSVNDDLSVMNAGFVTPERVRSPM